MPFGCGVNGAFAIAEDLGAPAVQSIVDTFVLIAGRIGAVYGHKNAVVGAGIWWVIFHLISGFMRSIVSLSIMRALAGVGGAFILPNAIALLTTTFPPGKMRNISVGLFGAMAPIGAAGGSIFPGFFGQLLPFKYLFFFLTVLGAVIFTIFAFVVPGEKEPFDKGGLIDYVGSYFGVAGLVLFNFIWNQAPAVGWKEPYEYILLIISFLHFGLFILWEGRFAKQPILPLDIWSAPSFGMMILSAFFTFMAVGMVIWYITVWNLQIRHYTLLLNGAAYATLAVMGAVAAIISAKLIPHLPAQYILCVGSLSTCIALILVATMPAQQTYWAQVFPALIFTAFGPDFLFTAAQIIASNTVKRHEQGIAGSLVGTLLNYGLSTGVGLAGTVEAYTNDSGRDPVQGIRNALYLGIGMTGISAIIALVFVRIPKDRREGWDEDTLPSVQE
ncbi:major facilitator superfamily domain-containing protein [Xylogone sp. PMI_703]|nr:major facilitator superfamily domain-containing protein [Xylogone sp. PMI_703]